jgi:hypothetical protein
VTLHTLLALDAAATVALAGLAGVAYGTYGCAWILAHDPVANVPYDGDTWRPPNTLQGYCGAALGCPQGPGPVFMGRVRLDGGNDADE